MYGVHRDDRFLYIDQRNGKKKDLSYLILTYLILINYGNIGQELLQYMCPSVCLFNQGTLKIEGER